MKIIQTIALCLGLGLMFVYIPLQVVNAVTSTGKEGSFYYFKDGMYHEIEIIIEVPEDAVRFEESDGGSLPITEREHP